MAIEYKQAALTQNEQQIIYENILPTERNAGCEIFQVPERDDFMLRIPEPVEGNIKFGVFKLGLIKGTLSRKDIYEDR